MIRQQQGVRGSVKRPALLAQQLAVRREAADDRLHSGGRRRLLGRRRGDDVREIQAGLGELAHPLECQERIRRADQDRNRFGQQNLQLLREVVEDLTPVDGQPPRRVTAAETDHSPSEMTQGPARLTEFDPQSVHQ
ncbi:hypothetical protein ACFQ0T_28585 [Kitasatospora gansuensis]